MIGLEGGERRVRVVMREMDRGEAERGAGLPRDGLDDDLRGGHLRQLAGDFRRVDGIDGDKEAIRRDQRRRGVRRCPAAWSDRRAD